MDMNEKELERALECDAAVPPEHRGIVGVVVPAPGHDMLAKYPPTAASIKYPEQASKGTLFERLGALEDEVALLKKLLGV
jgi:hypothetical protein